MVVQLPPTQLSPEPQAVPHPPQFAGSVAVSTQVPPQSISPVGQTHAPEALHDWPVGQMPHEPPQPSSPQSRPVQSGVHAAMHVPPTQYRSRPRHRVPHPPQLFGSVVVSAHAPLQSVPLVHTQLPPESHIRSLGHEPQEPPQPSSPQTRPVQSGAQRQTPPAQNSSEAQVTPQPPQLFGSLDVSMQVPPHTVPEQTQAPEALHVSPPEHVPQDPPHPSLPQVRPLQSGVQGPHGAGRVALQSSAQPIPKDPVVG
jgi:hypothetical protein